MPKTEKSRRKINNVINMKVKETIPTTDSEVFIEFGISSWDPGVESIRRRKNNSDGSYDSISSSEIPIDEGFVDIGTLVCECLKRDKISKVYMSKILEKLTESIKRQGLIITIK